MTLCVINRAILGGDPIDVLVLLSRLCPSLVGETPLHKSMVFSSACLNPNLLSSANGGTEMSRSTTIGLLPYFHCFGVGGMQHPRVRQDPSTVHVV